MAVVRIGTAGWATPRAVAGRFPIEGSGLQRYAAVFNAAEINTTFYRPHRPTTFVSWAASTPHDFRFAVKVPKAITHERRLVDCDELLGAFLQEIAGLGDRLGPVLVQLPPGLAFDPDTGKTFFAGLRACFGGAAVCEPRHATWFTQAAEALLRDHGVARVAADPARHPHAARPGGWAGLAYWRLHGSPRMYFSAYSEAALEALAAEIRASAADEVWCIFDNTASGAAAADGLALQALLL